MSDYSQEEKRFYAETARGARILSKCTDRQGAIIVGNGRIQSYGWNYVTGGVEVTAIERALMDRFHREGDTIFLSYFPTKDEVKQLFLNNIKTVYFFGKINSAETASFINSLHDNCIPLEFVQLED